MKPDEIKITREALREMPVGSEKVFTAEDPRKVELARVTASQMQRHLGCRFSVEADYENKKVYIRKSMI